MIVTPATTTVDPHVKAAVPPDTPPEIALFNWSSVRGVPYWNADDDGFHVTLGAEAQALLQQSRTESTPVRSAQVLFLFIFVFILFMRALVKLLQFFVFCWLPSDVFFVA
jgi:hypothetical protein